MADSCVSLDRCGSMQSLSESTGLHVCFTRHKNTKVQYFVHWFTVLYIPSWTAIVVLSCTVGHAMKFFSSEVREAENQIKSEEKVSGFLPHNDVAV